MAELRSKIRRRRWGYGISILGGLLLAGIAHEFASCGYLAGVLPVAVGDDPPLDEITLPDGFRIQSYATEVEGARSLTLGPGGIVFVGSRDPGNVYALIPASGRDRAQEIVTVARDLDSPNGVAFRDGSLYVAEQTRVLRFDDIAERLRSAPEPVVVSANFPDQERHGWKFIAFGPDGKLYVPVGAPCNVCVRRDERFSSITRMDPDGSNHEVFAHGVRNTVGFDWHPTTQVLWFTDNGRDGMGPNRPPDELNRAPEPGLHFGFPHCHGHDVVDPEHHQGHSCDDFVAPEAVFAAHVAALGMRFYTGDRFPERYRGGIFVAQHGSWDRPDPIGYRVVFVPIRGSEAGEPQVFARGWLRRRIAWGRPVDLLVMPDGSLLVSDDKADAVYRIHYE